MKIFHKCGSWSLFSERGELVGKLVEELNREINRELERQMMVFE